LDVEHFSLYALESPRRRPKAGKEEELNPFVRGFGGGKELIELGPIGMAFGGLDVAPTDLESDTADEGIVEKLKIQARLLRLVLDDDDEAVGGRAVRGRRGGLRRCGRWVEENGGEQG
jgi:hypothetical protein